MKKLFLSLLAVAALASCSKTESAYMEQDSEIKLAPVTSMVTKAYAPVYGAINQTTYPETENFKVTAYWTNPANAQQKNVTYLNNVDFTNKGQYWGGTTTYYWPKNGYLQFACYSPATVANVKHAVDTDTYTVEGYTQTTNTAETIDFLLAPKTVGYTAETATENVSVVFEHALSWITIQLKAKNPEAAKAFVVHDLIINDVYNQGDLTAEMPSKVWNTEAYTADQDITVVEGDKIAVGTVAAVAEDNAKGTVVIPQAPTTLTINYTQKAMGAATDLEGQTVTVPLELDVEGAVWEPGKHYIYTVIFDLDEILINPSVADWEDVVVDDKDTDDAGQIATVSNLDEFEAALAANVEEIILTGAVELTKEVNVNYNVAIKGTADGSFTGAEGLLVTGGVVSFEDVVFNNATGTQETSVYVRNGNTNVTFDGCTFAQYTWEGIQYTSEDGLWVCVNNCTFNGAANRDLHLQVKNLSNAEVKITNNTFNGDDTDSYVTVYGFKHERMILEGNKTEKDANTVNVWISNGFDWNNLTLTGFVVETETINASTATILTKSLTTDKNIDLKGLYLDGKNNSITATADGLYVLNVYGGSVVKNLAIDAADKASVRGIMIKDNSADVVIRNVQITNTLYPINTSLTAEAKNKIVVVDSKLHGWTSYSNFASAEFINTEFRFAKYGHVKSYITTVFENCTFDKDITIDFEEIGDGESLTFTNCYVNGVKLTAANVASYLKCCDSADAENPWAQAIFN